MRFRKGPRAPIPSAGADAPAPAGPIDPHHLNAAALRRLIQGATDWLERNAADVNQLNVFPVPDGDTGSNMLATVRVALAEAESASGGSAAEIATAIKRGALHGARGNSGVIASQIFGGMAEALGAKKRFNGLDLAFALRKGVERSYQAVKEPVEGTILTVVRDAADTAVAAAERDRDIESVLAATVDAAEKSVARTPSLLAVLRDAGVVDAGGQGLFRLFQGALMLLAGETPSADARPGTAPRSRRPRGPRRAPVPIASPRRQASARSWAPAATRA